MIEIEKKFLLTTPQQQVLLDGADALGEKTMEDAYLDTDDYRLTTRDFWFRKRNGAYELKVPLRSSSATPSTTNRYHELTDIDSIRQALELPDETDFEATLQAAGIAPFMTCYTQRASYEKQGFHIDIDAATYEGSDFVYALAEIELLVQDESEADDADQRIVTFAKSFALTTDQVILGKVASYLKAKRPAHYDALVRAGVLS